MSAYIGNAVARPLSDDTLSIYRSPWLTPVGQPAFYRQIAQMRQRYIEEAEARYAAPDFPVRIVWGQDDAWIPLEQGQALADRIANGKLIRVPRAGHLVQEDAPEAIVAAVLDTQGQR